MGDRVTLTAIGLPYKPGKERERSAPIRLDSTVAEPSPNNSGINNAIEGNATMKTKGRTTTATGSGQNLVVDVVG